MTLQELDSLLNIDYRKEENREKIQKALRRIKPFKKFKDEIPLEKLEKLLFMFHKKYNIKLEQLNTDGYGNESSFIWRALILVDKTETETYKNYYVYGISFYEVLAKASLFIYSMIKGEEEW